MGWGEGEWFSGVDRAIERGWEWDGFWGGGRGAACWIDKWIPGDEAHTALENGYAGVSMLSEEVWKYLRMF